MKNKRTFVSQNIAKLHQKLNRIEENVAIGWWSPKVLEDFLEKYKEDKLKSDPFKTTRVK